MPRDLACRPSLRRLPQLDPVPLPVHAPAERPVFRTVDLLVDRDPAGTQLRQQPIEVGHAEIEHLRLGGVAEVRCFGRERGPELIAGLVLGELEIAPKEPPKSCTSKPRCSRYQAASAAGSRARMKTPPSPSTLCLPASLIVAISFG
jgi:hypothetical protein